AAPAAEARNPFRCTRAAAAVARACRFRWLLTFTNPAGSSSSSTVSSSARSLQAQVEELGPWFHNLHLPGGVQTAPEPLAPGGLPGLQVGGDLAPRAGGPARVDGPGHRLQRRLLQLRAGQGR